MNHHKGLSYRCSFFLLVSSVAGEVKCKQLWRNLSASHCPLVAGCGFVPVLDWTNTHKKNKTHWVHFVKESKKSKREILNSSCDQRCVAMSQSEEGDERKLWTRQRDDRKTKQDRAMPSQLCNTCSDRWDTSVISSDGRTVTDRARLHRQNQQYMKQSRWHSGADARKDGGCNLE